MQHAGGRVMYQEQRKRVFRRQAWGQVLGVRGCTEQRMDISFLFSVAAAGQTVPGAPTA